MKKLFFYVTMLMFTVSIVSCSSDESKVKSAFKDYVQSNFNNPKDLVEIITVDSCDTVGFSTVTASLKDVKHMYDSIKAEDEKINQRVNAMLKDESKLHSLYRENHSFFETHKAYAQKSLELMQENGSYGKVMEAMGGEHTDGPDDIYAKVMKAKGSTFIQWTIKARVNVKGNPLLQTYYAICDTTMSTIRISKKKVQTTDIMDEAIANQIMDLVQTYSYLSTEYAEHNEIGKELINYATINGMKI